MQERSGLYRPHGFIKLGLEGFKRLHSQKFTADKEPLRPRFEPDVDILLDKARESALLAVSIYNNPILKHRTYGYIVQMVIAWTALFHAFFIRRKVDYYHKEADGSYKTIDDDKKAWELGHGICEHWKGKQDPVSATPIASQARLTLHTASVLLHSCQIISG